MKRKSIKTGIFKTIAFFTVTLFLTGLSHAQNYSNDLKTDTIYLQIITEGKITLSVFFKDTIVLNEKTIRKVSIPNLVVFKPFISEAISDTFPIYMRKSNGKKKLLICIRKNTEANSKYLIIVRRKVFIVFNQWYYFWDDTYRKLMD